MSWFVECLDDLLWLSFDANTYVFKHRDLCAYMRLEASEFDAHISSTTCKVTGRRGNSRTVLWEQADRPTSAGMQSIEAVSSSSS